jgi:hypothetical protein
MAFNPVKDHPINDTLKRLLAFQRNVILTGASSDLDERHRWYLDRIFYLATRAASKVKKKLSLSINLNALNNLNSSAEGIIAELNNYISNRNPGHVAGAFNQAEQGFQIYLYQAFPTTSNEGIEEGEAIIESLRRSSASAINEIKSEKSKILSDITTLSASVSDNLAAVAALKTDIDSHQALSQGELETIKSAYKSLAQKFEVNFQTKTVGWDISSAEEIERIGKSTDELVEKISEKEKEARNLVQSVGEVLITGTYQKTAADESKLANTFRWITIALFSTGIFIVLSNYIAHLVAVFGGSVYDETPWTILTRFLTALVISLPAFYTARESARHRTNADRARQRELELSTLGPFIELLPTETKTVIRDRLTDRYFGNSVDAHKIESLVDTESLAKIAEAIARLGKPA